jgi:hypothetical protein
MFCAHGQLDVPQQASSCRWITSPEDSQSSRSTLLPRHQSVRLLKVRRFQRKTEGPPSARPGRNSHGISRIVGWHHYWGASNGLWIIARLVARNLWTWWRVLSWITHVQFGYFMDKQKSGSILITFRSPWTLVKCQRQGQTNDPLLYEKNKIYLLVDGSNRLTSVRIAPLIDRSTRTYEISLKVMIGAVHWRERKASFPR